MSKKRKTKNQKVTEKATTEKSEVMIREVELGGAAEEDLAEEETEIADAAEGENEENGEAAGGGEAEMTDDTEKALESASEEGTTERKKAGWLHRMNIYYPWLKFVMAIVLVIGVVWGGFSMGQMISNSAHELSEGQDVAETEGDKTEGQDTEATEKLAEGENEENGEAAGGEEAEGDGEKPAEEQPKQDPVTKPTATTNPPVEVPATGGKKLVALTFDDGPSTVTTGRLLDILKAKGVKATFFVVGSMASRAPELLKREVAEGHEVGSHSSYHQDLSKLSAADLQADVANMDWIFTEVLGRKVEIMRPPYGAVSDIMRGYLGKPMIYWSVDPLDWKYRDAATVRANVVGATHDGAIVLMHDIHATTVDAVAGIIDDLRAQGYEFLTVSELAAARGIGLTSGVVYYNFRP